MKRVGLTIFLMIFLTGFVSAASSISDLLSSINEQTLTLFLIFMISFTILFYALKRAFKQNKAIPVVLSLLLSFGIIYWINKIQFNLMGWFYKVGIPEGTSFLLLPIIAIALIILLFVKMKKNSLIILGAFLIFISFFVYEKEILITIGVVLILIRILMGKNWKKEGGWYEKKYWKDMWKRHKKK